MGRNSDRLRCDDHPAADEDWHPENLRCPEIAERISQTAKRAAPDKDRSSDRAPHRWWKHCARTIVPDHGLYHHHHPRHPPCRCSRHRAGPRSLGRTSAAARARCHGQATRGRRADTAPLRHRTRRPGGKCHASHATGLINARPPGDRAGWLGKKVAPRPRSPVPLLSRERPMPAAVVSAACTAKPLSSQPLNRRVGRRARLRRFPRSSSR